MKVIVVGAGMTGASIAAELAVQGVDVTIVEHGAVGGGTSSLSYGWINSNNKFPLEYFELNRRGLEAHVELSAGSPEWFVPSGHVEVAVGAAHAAELEERVKRLHELDYEARWISADEARRLNPGFRVPGEGARIAAFPAEGYCFPALFVAEQLRRAQASGAKLVRNRVVAFEDNIGHPQVVLASGNILIADHVVLATGRWTNEVAELAGVDRLMQDYAEPGDATVGYLALTDAVPAQIRTVLTTPHLNIRPAGGGTLMLQALDLDASATPGVPVPADIRDEFERRLEVLCEDTPSPIIRRIEVARRALPADGLSILGSPPGAAWLYIAATHSGATLAPYLGKAVAAELLGVTEQLFEGFRPGRFVGSGNVEALVPPRNPGEQ